MKTLNLLTVVAAGVILAGCGGGGGGDTGGTADPGMTDPGMTDAVPASANRSSWGLTRFLLVLTALLGESLEPLELTNFAPATSDNEEPDDVH